MIVLTPIPSRHTSAARHLCARCEWARLHYNLVHHVRVRGEHKV